MLRNLHAVVGGGARFWAFVVLTAASAVIQAAAVLSLLPILSRLLGPDPASAGGWLLVLVALSRGCFRFFDNVKTYNL